MSKEQLLRELADAFEKLIGTATEAAQHSLTREGNEWGSRHSVAHTAGWEVIATVRIPRIVAGMPPFEYADETQQTVMDDAINATIVAMIGDQPFDTVGAACCVTHIRVISRCLQKVGRHVLSSR